MGVANWGCAVPYSLFIDVQPTASWNKVWAGLCSWVDANVWVWGNKYVGALISVCTRVRAIIYGLCVCRCLNAWLCLQYLYLWTCALCLFHGLHKVTTLKGVQRHHCRGSSAATNGHPFSRRPPSVSWRELIRGFMTIRKIKDLYHVENLTRKRLFVQVTGCCVWDFKINMSFHIFEFQSKANLKPSETQ